MSPVKHSPAPWRVTPTGYVVNESGHIIAKLNHWPAGNYSRSMRDEQAVADGKLIAHAPELLRMVGGLRLVLDATSLYVPANAHPSITVLMDSSAALLREVTT